MVCIRRHQKHDYANYDQFVPNFDMVYETIKRVSVLQACSVSNVSIFEYKSWCIQILYRGFCYCSGDISFVVHYVVLVFMSAF